MPCHPSCRPPAFAAWAATRHTTYGLGATPAEVTARAFELAGRLDQEVTTFACPDLENIVSAQLQVVCNDSDRPASVRVYQRNVAVGRVRHPGFGVAVANIWPCALGHRTRLVAVDQGGHGVYLFGANACGNDVVTRHLVDGTRRPASPAASARGVSALKAPFGTLNACTRHPGQLVPR